jgi:hypothetical protein
MQQEYKADGANTKSAFFVFFFFLIGGRACFFRFFCAMLMTFNVGVYHGCFRVLRAVPMSGFRC